MYNNLSLQNHGRLSLSNPLLFFIHFLMWPPKVSIYDVYFESKRPTILLGTTICLTKVSNNDVCIRHADHVIGAKRLKKPQIVHKLCAICQGDKFRTFLATLISGLLASVLTKGWEVSFCLFSLENLPPKPLGYPQSHWASTTADGLPPNEG